MKKLILFVLIFFTFASISHAANQYGCTALTGGASGALDALDITGATTPNADNLAEGDSAWTFTISGATVLWYTYTFDASGTDAESSPTIIRPDDYATAGVWRLSLLNSNMIPDLSATYEGVLTNSAGLLAALDDETGTGLAVFNDSPTLITPALGTPSAAVLTNATGLPGTSITADSLLEIALDSTNAPTDNYILSFDLASGGFTWVIAGSGAGDLLADGTIPLTADWDSGPYEIRALTFESDVVTGTAPFTIASTTVVPNLNADLLDGESASAFEDADAAIVKSDENETITGNWTFESGIGTGSTAVGGGYYFSLEDTDLGTNYAGFGVFGDLTISTIYLYPLAVNTAGQSMRFAVPGNQDFSDGTTKSAAVGTFFTALEDIANAIDSDHYTDGSIDSEHLSTSSQVVNTITSFASPTTANPYTLTAANSYNFALFYGATGEIDLPAGVDGMSGIIYNTGAFTITIDPNGTEIIVRTGTVQTGGVSMTLSSGAGNFVSLVFDGTRWITIGYNGTLAVGT